MFSITDVVKNLIILNVLLFFGTLVLGEVSFGYEGTYISVEGEDNIKTDGVHVFVDDEKVEGFNLGRYLLAVYFPASAYFQPFQLVTHMFMHMDMPHLFFNMIGLLIFGVPLERIWGASKFLFFYLASGFGALIVQMLIYYFEISSQGDAYYAQYMLNPFACMLGASGAVFGLLAGYGVEYAEKTIMLIFPPIPMKGKYIAMIFGVMELFMGIGTLSGSFDSGIAHFAHLGGAITGFMLVLYWRRR